MADFLSKISVNPASKMVSCRVAKGTKEVEIVMPLSEVYYRTKEKKLTKEEVLLQEAKQRWAEYFSG